MQLNIMGSLRKWDVISQAFMCRRILPEFPDTPIYICVLVRDQKPSNIAAEIFAKNVQASAQLPQNTSVFVAERDAAKLLEIARAVPESAVYYRENREAVA